MAPLILRHEVETPFVLIRKAPPPRPRLQTLDYSEGSLITGAARTSPRPPAPTLPNFKPVPASESRSVPLRAPPGMALPMTHAASVLLDDPKNKIEREASTARYLLVEDDLRLQPMADARQEPRTTPARLLRMLLTWSTIVVALGAAAAR